METSEDLKTFGRARLSFAREAEIDEFSATLEKFERGEITPDQWRGFRLLRGTYGQRQADDASMLRVKIPQGLLTADQLNAFADVADQYSRGFGHITTRQNLQLHFIKLHDMARPMTAAGRGRSHDARGLRQFRPQHHGVSVCRRRARPKSSTSRRTRTR